MSSLLEARLSRRLALGLGTSSMLWNGRVARAADTDQTRFLFIHCVGGWDPFMVFAPIFDDSRIELLNDRGECSDSTCRARASE